MSDTTPPTDHVHTDEENAGRPVEENVRSRATWMRLLFMVISYVCVSLAALVGSVVVVLGFLWVLFAGQINPQLRAAGQAIAAYIYENVRYLSFNTDDKPFPMGGNWPSAKSG